MILLAAATPWECRPLARRLALRPERAGFWRGAWTGKDVALTQTGMGPRRAEEALARLEAPLGPLAAVFSVGFAGALQPGMRRGDIVADPHGAPLAWVEAARALAQETRLTLHLGRVLSEDRVLAEPSRKRALGESLRAAAVDMESGAVRAWAARRNVPFMPIRVVLDALHQGLPSDYPEGDGAAELARYALRHLPRLPSLLLLGWRQRRAAGRLGDFLSRWILACPY